MKPSNRQNVFLFVTVSTGSAKKSSLYLADACCVFYIYIYI